MPVPEKRRRFSPQFKAEAVQLVVTTGRPVAEVTRKLQINEGTLGNWVNTWRRDNPEPEPEISPVERARLSELKAEVRRLGMENESRKSSSLLCPDPGLSQRCALIETEKANYSISWMCRMLGVARSSFYAGRHRAETRPRPG